jgi:putative membrane protein
LDAQADSLDAQAEPLDAQADPLDAQAELLDAQADPLDAQTDTGRGAQEASGPQAIGKVSEVYKIGRTICPSSRGGDLAGFSQ